MEHDEEGDEEDDDDDDLAEETLGKPLMYHDGTKWKTSGSDEARPSHGRQDWLQDMLAREGRGGEGSTGEDGRAGEMERRLSTLGLECGAAEMHTEGGKEGRPGEDDESKSRLLLPAGLDENHHPSGSSSSAGWCQPRLTFRPASVEGGTMEYRSSDDDEAEEEEEEEEEGGSHSWRWKDSREIISSRTSLDVLPLPEFSSDADSSSPPPPTHSCVSEIPSFVPSPPPPQHHHLHDRRLDPEDSGEEEEEANNTLQIEVKRRKRGCSRSEGS